MRNIFRPTKFKYGIPKEHEDVHQLQALWPRRSKVKVARSRDASGRCWPISRERNILAIPKLVGRLSTPRSMRTSFKVKGKCQGHHADIMLRLEVRHIFRTERPTNFKLQTLYSLRTKTRIAVIYHRQQGQRLRSRCNVVRTASVRCWPISLERKVPETSKLVSNYGCHQQ